MKFLSILISLLFIPTFANAVPNYWETFDTRGYSIYKIESTIDTTLIITCNYAAGAASDHSVVYRVTVPQYNNIEVDLENKNNKYNLSFLFDGEKVITPPISTSSPDGSASWSSFTKTLVASKRFDLFYAGEQIAKFKPLNMQEVKELEKCASMYFYEDNPPVFKKHVRK